MMHLSELLEHLLKTDEIFKLKVKNAGVEHGHYLNAMDILLDYLDVRYDLNNLGFEDVKDFVLKHS